MLHKDDKKDWERLDKQLFVICLVAILGVCISAFTLLYLNQKLNLIRDHTTHLNPRDRNDVELICFPVDSGLETFIPPID